MLFKAIAKSFFRLIMLIVATVFFVKLQEAAVGSNRYDF